MKQLTAKEKFNALADAKHIFAYKEDDTAFRIIDIVNSEQGCKAVVELEDGTVTGLFTDSQSAKDALHEVKAVFDGEQPLIKVRMKKTPKGQSVYFVEVI